ncbi:MAG: cysteate synthase [Bacteroidales bacterium]|nr:cysteate synthase [Bacteroidales bacterium]
MSEIQLPTRYHLASRITGNTFEDKGWILDATGEPKPSLLSSVYDNIQITLNDDRYGIYKFGDWLPLHRILEGSSAPVTFKSEKFANHLGLENLYITFSGYWPEKGALMRTCSFKETEAYSVCARLRPEQHQTLVVASAGNTARAFARVCSDNNIPLLLSVPSDTLCALWFDTPLNDCITLISPPPGCDYYDAIHLSNLVCQIDGFIPEGGAKNIARRDGMATTVLSAATTIGRIPDLYFQAIGSGTGAIAAWEANLRLLSDGRFGSHKMKLVLSQNYPFHPMVDAWKARSRDLFPQDDQLAREQVMEINAKVLSNRKPPWGIIGGLFDAMVDTDGELEFMTNREAADAARLFEETEGIDIHPAAAVATASLIHAVNNKSVSPDAVIMLNITGGGEERLKREKGSLDFLKPSLVISPDVHLSELASKLMEI